jgi:molybdopterin-guanine dinucleotide biosynthesis protein A
MTSNQKHTAPTIKGLILIGGKSTRMGTDKSELHYHGKPQKEFVRDLLVSQGIETFYSVQPFKSVESDAQVSEQIIDILPNLGPFGGICSAFQKDSNMAWFVLATDLPFVDENLIKLLLKKRNPEKMATAVKGKNKQFPEPLITIYEPKVYPILLEYLARDCVSPREVLINSDVEIVEVDDELIRNVNTPEEYQETIKKIQ